MLTSSKKCKNSKTKSQNLGNESFLEKIEKMFFSIPVMGNIKKTMSVFEFPKSIFFAPA